MRVLDTTSYELQIGTQSIFQENGYAILSHRWIGQEITLQRLRDHLIELRTGTRPLSSPQLDKIHGACEIARSQGFKWMWIDSCCIDKTSTVEESESINSMFKWYRDAKLCITYLNDVKKKHVKTNATGPEIFQSTEVDGPSLWFSRGWTLQELIAPQNLQFYDMGWQYLGTKIELATPLERITRIQEDYLTGEKHFGEACIATKMSWMAGRTTVREEDIAYSMLGIFNITMPPQYGEGMRAFMRLQQILLASSTDESLFAWRMPELNAGLKYKFALDGWAPDQWGLLAPSPDWFSRSNHVTTISTPGSFDFSMITQGLRAPIPRPRISYAACCGICLVFVCSLGLMVIPFMYFMETRLREKSKQQIFTLNCWEKSNMQLVPVRIRLCQMSNDRIFKRVQCTEFVEIGSSNEFDTEPGEGIVLQPQPGYIN